MPLDTIKCGGCGRPVNVVAPEEIERDRVLCATCGAVTTYSEPHKVVFQYFMPNGEDHDWFFPTSQTVRKNRILRRKRGECLAPNSSESGRNATPVSTATGAAHGIPTHAFGEFGGGEDE